MADRMKDQWKNRLEPQPRIPIPPGAARVEIHHDPVTAAVTRHTFYRDVKSPEIEELDQHLEDAVRYGLGAGRVQHRPAPTTLDTFKTPELVMEMLKRGFAVMKLPEGGGPPETLRDG